MLWKNKIVKILSLITVFGIALFIWSNTSAAMGISVRTQTPIDPFRNIINEFQSRIKNDNLNIKEKEALLQKFEPMIIEATQRADALKQNAITPLIKRTPFATPTQGSEIKISDGINNRPIIPRYSSDFILINSWAKTIGNKTYLVYAGALAKDTSQGLVYMQSPQSFGFKIIFSPLKNGLLTAISSNNLILTLETENGDLVFFDAEKEQFVDSADKPILPPAYP